MKMRLILLITFVTQFPSDFGQNFTQRFRWSMIKFDFGSPAVGNQQQRSMKQVKLLKSNDNVIRGMGLWKDKLFLSVLHLPNDPKKGTLFPLNYVDLNATDFSPSLTPYSPSIKHIQSAYFIDIDPCDRLWLMDDTKNTLIVVDLPHSKILRKKKLHTKRLTSLINVVVDVAKSACDNAYAYIPDPNHFALITYRFRDNKYWRFDRAYFSPTHTLSNDFFAIYTLALSNPNPGGYRTAYIQPIVSEYVITVSTQILQNPKTTGLDALEYRVFGYKGKKSKSTIVYYDKINGILFYDLYEKHAIGCWNFRRFPQELSEKTTGVIKFNPGGFEYTHFADLRPGSANELLIGMRNLVHYDGHVESNEFALYSIAIPDLVRNTICE